ncbi:MAG TPA: DUF3298 and DUF4163 domain-containing protein [Tissierellia bacterium]|nr:DUF3298 and DUF4163 domain-containing protein [Tissierellia bacterium]
MKNNCYKASIAMGELKRTLMYKDVEVLFLSIKYPVVSLPCTNAQTLINNQIAMDIVDYIKHIEYLYNMAVEGYRDSVVNDYPFHGYSAYMEYIITYNKNCFLSLYIDKYEFTGGAHGSTTRSSHTWELWNGTNLTLNCFFKPGTDYRHLLLEEIIKEAHYNNKQNPYLYFEDYESLIIKNFNEYSFYLTPEGIRIYYQQYDIGPYASGIIEFTVPYYRIKWYPNC